MVINMSQESSFKKLQLLEIFRNFHYCLANFRQIILLSLQLFPHEFLRVQIFLFCKFTQRICPLYISLQLLLYLLLLCQLSGQLCVSPSLVKGADTVTTLEFYDTLAAATGALVFTGGFDGLGEVGDFDTFFAWTFGGLARWQRKLILLRNIWMDFKLKVWIDVFSGGVHWHSFAWWSCFGFVIPSSRRCQIPQIHYALTIKRQKLVNGHGWPNIKIASNVQIARSSVEVDVLALSAAGCGELLHFSLFSLYRFD